MYSDLCILFNNVSNSLFQFTDGLNGTADATLLDSRTFGVDENITKSSQNLSNDKSITTGALTTEHKRNHDKLLTEWGKSRNASGEVSKFHHLYFSMLHNTILM